MIPKADGRERPLGIASLEDKIVQRALVEVLNAIYEPEFLGLSYGFRPGRNQHDALDALWVGIDKTPINWILDADIHAFFGAPETVRRQIVKVYHSVRSSDPHCPRVMRGYP
jgi:retron-type reverse transcriptase